MVAYFLNLLHFYSPYTLRATSCNLSLPWHTKTDFFSLFHEPGVAQPIMTFSRRCRHDLPKSPVVHFNLLQLCVIFSTFCSCLVLSLWVDIFLKCNSIIYLSVDWNCVMKPERQVLINTTGSDTHSPPSNSCDGRLNSLCWLVDS